MAPRNDISIPEIRNEESDRRPSEASKTWVSTGSRSCQGAGLDIRRYCTLLSVRRRRNIPNLEACRARYLPESGFIVDVLLIFQRLITWRRDCLEEKRRSRVDQGIWGVASIRVGFRQAPPPTAGVFFVPPSTARR